MQGLEGVEWELGFAYFSTWDLLHRGWKLATGTGKKVAYNENAWERRPIEPTDHLKLLLSSLMHKNATK